MGKRSRYRQKANAGIAGKDIDSEIESVISSISNDIDSNIQRYKRVGGTFDLLYVVKLIAAKYAVKAKVDMLNIIYQEGVSGTLEREYKSNQRLISVINNMIRIEST